MVAARLKRFFTKTSPLKIGVMSFILFAFLAWVLFIASAIGMFDTLYERILFIGTTFLLTVLNICTGVVLFKKIEATKYALEVSKKALSDLKLSKAYLQQTEKMAALGNIVAGVAHELNTPLGNTLITVTALQDFYANALVAHENGNLTEDRLKAFFKKIEKGLTIAHSSSLRAAQLVDNLKSVSVGQTDERCREFALKEIVIETTIIQNSLIEKNNHQVLIDIPDDLKLVSYPGSLYKIISNLVSNSIVHGFANRVHGVIKISAVQEDAMVKLIVSDNGCGIPTKILPEIFKPFFTTRSNRGGTGLGLHILLNEATKKLNGKLSVESIEGKGSTFTLIIPKDCGNLRTK